jgi:hypothetical protein
MVSAREKFVETLMLDEPRSLVTNKRSETSPVEYARQITTGGMPSALERNELPRGRRSDDYVELVLERGAMEASKLRQRRQLPAPRVAERSALEHHCHGGELSLPLERRASPVPARRLS